MGIGKESRMTRKTAPKPTPPVPKPKPGLVHHTDRGGQYAGTQYRAVLARRRDEAEHEPTRHRDRIGRRLKVNGAS